MRWNSGVRDERFALRPRGHMNRNPAQSAASLAGARVHRHRHPRLRSVDHSRRQPFSFAGEGSDAKLIGVFQVSVLPNIIHILLGLAGVALARTTAGARQYLLGGGVAFLVLWVLGIVNAGKWIPVNAADDWLHLASRRRPDRARVRDERESRAQPLDMSRRGRRAGSSWNSSRPGRARRPVAGARLPRRARPSSAATAS